MLTIKSLGFARELLTLSVLMLRAYRDFASVKDHSNIDATKLIGLINSMRNSDRYQSIGQNIASYFISCFANLSAMVCPREICGSVSVAATSSFSLLASSRAASSRA